MTRATIFADIILMNKGLWLPHILFCFSLGVMAKNPAFAKPPEECDQTNKNFSDIAKVGCAAECETYYQKNPEARPPEGAPPSCQASRIEHAYNMVSPVSCMKGAWEGVLSFPEMVKAYALMLEDVADYINKNMKEHQHFVSQCDKDPKCRREITRTLAYNQGKDEKGQWLIPDEVVDKEAQSTDIMTLLMKKQAHKASNQVYCQGLLSQINEEIRREGLEDFEFAKARYQKLATKDPVCLSALDLKPPNKESFVPKKTDSLLKKMGVMLQCYPPEKMTELICYEIAAKVADPLVLVAGAGLAVKIATSAKLGRKGAVKAATPNREIAAISKRYEKAFSDIPSADRNILAAKIEELERRGVDRKKIDEALNKSEGVCK